MARTLPLREEKPHRFDQVLGLLVAVDCGPPLTYASSLGASLLPTSLGPPPKLMPSGVSLLFPFPVFLFDSCARRLPRAASDTLRWCYSAPSWCMACRCLLAGTARAVVLPGLAQAFSRSASGDDMAVLLDVVLMRVPWCFPTKKGWV